MQTALFQRAPAPGRMQHQGVVWPVAMLDPEPREAKTYLGEFQFGASRPQKFIVDGMGQSLVKFRQSPQGPKLVTNEFVGYSVAGLLGLPVPDAGITHVDSTLLPNDGTLILPETDRHDSCVFRPGQHFYSRFVEPSDRVSLGDLEGLRTKNVGDFAGVILLDLLLEHWDRHPSNLNLLLHRGKDGNQIVVIDFGHSFGGGELWEVGNLSGLNLPEISDALPYSDVLEPYLSSITNPQRAFDPFLERLSDVQKEDFAEILDDVPNEWELTEAERLALLDLLATRARQLPQYLEERFKKDVWWQ